MRHAKSSWADSSAKDFDRYLNDRGRADASRMGKYLKELGIHPDQVFCSPAARTKETADLLGSELAIDPSSIQYENELYSGGVKAYLECIWKSNLGSECVMTIGHNPMTEQLVSVLDDGDPLHRMPTATVACFETDVENWADITPENCSLKWVMTPKKLSKS